MGALSAAEFELMQPSNNIEITAAQGRRRKSNLGTIENFLRRLIASLRCPVPSRRNARLARQTIGRRRITISQGETTPAASLNHAGAELVPGAGDALAWYGRRE